MLLEYQHLWNVIPGLTQTKVLLKVQLCQNMPLEGLSECSTKISYVLF